MINLADFGYTDFFQRQTNDDNLITTRVTAVHYEQYIIMSQHGENGAKPQFEKRNKPRYFCAYNNNALIAWIEVIDTSV